MDKIDTLPGPQARWKLYELTIEGSLLDEDGRKQTEVLDLWDRDANEVVADLMGNWDKFRACTEIPGRQSWRSQRALR